jgi:hypothetical protein
VSNFCTSRSEPISVVNWRRQLRLGANFSLVTYHVNNGTNDLVNLSGPRRFGSHITSSEDRQNGFRGLEGGVKPGSPQRGAHSPSRSNPSNAAAHCKKARVSDSGRMNEFSCESEKSYLLNMMDSEGTGWGERRGNGDGTGDLGEADWGRFWLLGK